MIWFILFSLGITLLIAFWIRQKKGNYKVNTYGNKEPKENITSTLPKKHHISKKDAPPAFSYKPDSTTVSDNSFKIVYGTHSGTSEQLAKELYAEAKDKFPSVNICDAANYDPDTLVDEDYIVFIFSTYTDGSPPPTAKTTIWWLTEEAKSPRSGNLLRNVKFTVFGLGNSVYKGHYNTIARTINKTMYQLGGTRFWPLGLGDENENIQETFDSWKARMWRALLRKGITLDADPIPPKQVDSDEEENQSDTLMDLEDLGSALTSTKEDEGIKDMLSEGHKKRLKKVGYKILGTHSAVKMCRWTKNMLRGRGGCYKHTFYGIESHRCMETTPSMACANKCVFCWRHYKNPVGTEWKWNTDPPEQIVEDALKNHIQMIKATRGIPGVIPERYDEGFHPKHCALSLVGEPIIYPHINEFVGLLHDKGISTFLVTNAQFPSKIDELSTVTQLYVSVDAATPEELKAVDRPLFEDYWERFLASIDSLSRKGQRTVYRLTLVKGWNMTEIEAYASLILRGEPDFIEIKGVTFSGGKKPKIGMKEVPWHEEVVHFGNAISQVLEGRYVIASEHQHSCCILLADPHKFNIDGVWHTWIDFDKFIELQAGDEPFSSLDYMAPTPSWAIFGEKERGFDPVEVRVDRKGNPIDTTGKA